MLRFWCLALAAVLVVSAPARADEFFRRFEAAADLAGLKIVRGQWEVKEPPRSRRGIFGALGIPAAEDGFAAFTVPEVNARTLSGRAFWLLSRGHREVGVIIGEPSGAGTLPSYYATVADDDESGATMLVAGQLEPGFLERQIRLSPICVQELTWISSEYPLEFSLAEDDLIFRKGKSECRFILNYAARPVGKITVIDRNRGSVSAPVVGLATILVRHSGAPGSKNHADAKLRRHIRGLME